MPPRFAYWTILIDDRPTAFRARDRQDLLPTLTQLRRTNQNVVLKWFAQGRLWESPEAQRESWRKPKPKDERRGRDWRPGGDHRDPRARFDRRPARGVTREHQPPRAAGGAKPWQNRPAGDRKPFGRPRPTWKPTRPPQSDSRARRRKKDDEPPDRDR